MFRFILLLVTCNNIEGKYHTKNTVANKKLFASIVRKYCEENIQIKHRKN